MYQQLRGTTHGDGIPTYRLTTLSYPGVVARSGGLALATILIAAVIIIVTGFDYVWVGPAPLWVVVISLSLLPVLLRKNYLARLIDCLKTHSTSIVLPWVLFSIVVVISDLYNGALGESMMDAVVLNWTTLTALLVVAAWSSFINRTHLVFLVVSIGAVQGLIALAQYLGVEQAWSISDYLLSVTARDKQAYLIGAFDSFENIGRVRGTHIYVHKFTPFQSMIASFAIVVVLAGKTRLKVRTIKYGALCGMTLIAVLGALLTFSRSTVVGLSITLAIALIESGVSRRRTVFFVAMAFVIALLGAFVFLDIAGSSQFSRVFDFSDSSSRNELRYSVWSYGWETFLKSPLIGEGFVVGMTSLPTAIHSVFIRILASYGILGALAYVAVVIGVLRTLWRGLRGTDDNQRVFVLAGVAAFLMALIDSNTHSSGFFWADITQPVLVGLIIGQCGIAHRTYRTASYAEP